MDRMHKKELEVLFKVLRGVPDFPQFTYVCAFDRGALSQILRRDDSEESRRETERFLEKFFPEEIPLPKIEASRLALEFERRLYATCDCADVLDPPDERKIFKDDFSLLWRIELKKYFSNLRRIKLLANRLSRSLPVLGQEVNLRDFVLLEMFRMMAPVLYEEIYRNARYFTFPQWRVNDWAEVVDADDGKAQAIRDQYFNLAFAGLQRSPPEVALVLLRELFPAVNSYLKGVRVSEGILQSSEEAERKRRIYHPSFFPRYFIFSVPADLFGEAELTSFVDAMNKADDSAKCVSLFTAKYERLQDLPMKRGDFLRRVAFSIGRFGAAALEGLAEAISLVSDKLGHPDTAGPLDEILGVRIVFGAANQLRASVGTQKILEGAIRDATSDIFATRILNEAFSEVRPRFLAEGIVIVKEDLERGFRRRMLARYGPLGKSSFFPMSVRGVAPLGRWAFCGTEGKQQVHSYLQREFTSGHWKLGQMLRVLMSPEDYPGRPDHLSVIKMYFPPEEARRLLDEYGSTASASPDDDRAISEFKSLYPSGS
jgi:hypothetical protein